ncbi:MAG: OmpA family protein [Gammaproteobacteria bacterium]|nr:OmpA family protein [Gammaproteobacteria bacterium]
MRTLAACVLIPVFMSGCASTQGGPYSDWNACIIGGLVAGGVGAGLAGGDVGGAVIGALSGAVLGGVLCREGTPMMAGDSDGDGVPDDVDECPGTPPEARGMVDAKGCPKYSDADGVPDYLDKCPGTPAGVKVDADGCPVDSDGDGVADYVDKCPNTPKGVRVDTNGCPLVGDVAIVTNINFDFDSAKIRDDAKGKLARVINTLKENPDVRVRIEGHADSTGPADYNQGLSERRAEAVRKYLVDRGVSITRLSVVGKGEAEPLVSNDTRAGRAVNRRVEFKVIK